MTDKSRLFAHLADLPNLIDAPGCAVRRFSGERVMLQVAELPAGEGIPRHSHHNEQIVIVLEGRIRLDVGEEGAMQSYELGPGDLLLVPPDVPHGGVTIEDARVIDAFSPPRTSLMAEAET